MSKKTNAMRFLDSKKISYKVREYKVDEDNLDAIHVAQQINLPAQQVFKTLVVRGDKTGVMLACIPGDSELDLKLLAKASNNKSISMVALKDVLPLTGYIRGGVSPLRAKKNYPLYLDITAEKWTEITISAGLRGYQIVIAPNDLLKSLQQTFLVSICM